MMTHGPLITYEQWDVVIVPFPFVDMPIQKPRPALVISTRTANQQNAHTLLSMITTAARSHWPSDVDIKNLAKAGLHVPSLIRCKLFTLPNTLIDRQIGRLEPVDQRLCTQTLRQLLNFL